MDCSRRSVQDSSVAYDQRLLSKIGKTTSPQQQQQQQQSTVSQQQGSSGGGEARSSLSVPSPSRQSSFSSTGHAEGGGMLDIRWANSPQSASADRLSPGRAGWNFEFAAAASPGSGAESNSAPSSAMLGYDPFHHYYNQHHHRRISGIAPHHDDPYNRNRGSYDGNMFFPSSSSDLENETSNAPPDELNARLSLRLRAATPPAVLLPAPAAAAPSSSSSSSHPMMDPPTSRLGMKRRASSPPRDPADRPVLRNGSTSSSNTSPDLWRRKSSTNLSSSAAIGFPTSGYNRDSLSSTSSSLRTYGSFSSSAAFSSSASSSLSYDRPEMMLGESDHALHNNPPGATTLLPNISTSGGDMPPRKVAIRNNNPTTTDGNTLRAANKSSIGGLYICDCCLKKPKRFDTLEELR